MNKYPIKQFRATFQFCTKYFSLISEKRFLKRAVTVALIFTLLMPAFLLGDWVKSVAAFQSSSTSSLPQHSAPNAAPPVPFIYNSSNTFSAKFASTVLTVNTTIANGFVSAVNFFKTPQMPEGFEMAKPISPATGFLFSLGDSVRSFFGFFSTSNSSNAMLTPPPPPVPPGSPSFDFDGDGKADVARWKSSTGAWEIKYSSNGTNASGTLAAGGLAPADYDGDGKTDLASFNNGTWNILQSSNSQTVQVTGFGQTGDVPASGNYIGNSNADLAVWRPSNGTWYVREVGNTTVTSYQFGQSGDIAVPGNYDGDSVMDYAVFRPAGGVWHIQGSSSGYYYMQWGLASDIPVPADFDGDGKTDPSVYRGSTGTWYYYKSSTNDGSYVFQTWGNYGDQPVPADYDGDGKADFSIWRPTTGVWKSIKSSNSAYDYKTLGMNGDMAVSSAYLKQIGGQVFSYDFAKTRLSPKNSTGGTDLYSRNFGWESGLVGLSGRAGLNAGFGISYNSLVWTKQDNTIIFDADVSNVSPGFRFGFPTIEPVYFYDGGINEDDYFAYLMVTPSGNRVEFKQIGASEYFETADSSYTQLKTKTAPDPNEPVEDIEITVTGTDGTQMTYEWKAGAFRCSEIKDRNGNFITIFHDEQGLLKTVTDTLGRVITVNYDSELYPTSITQDWQLSNGESSTTTQHTYATFVYTGITVNPSFDSSLTIFGPTSGTAIKVLDKVIYGTSGSSNNTGETRFEYNDFGQVKKIRNMAADGHELNYVRTNLETPGTNLTDVPRLSQIKSWAENFNGGAEIIVNNTLQTGQQVSDLDGNTVTASLIQVSMQNHPTGNTTNTYVGESGWKEALLIRVDDYTSANNIYTLQRSNWTKWTQDNTNLSYIKNPRVTKTKIGDSSSVRRTEIDYLNTGSLAAFGLVKEVRTYDNTTNVLKKKSVINYNDDTAYLSRRIIGLPSQSELYDGNNALMSKVTYGYDGGDFTDSSLQQNISPVQHDNTNYGASFITGRGNLTSTSRHDVLGQSSAVTSSVKYNTAGAVVAQIDPLGRTAKIGYADKFNDGGNSRNTYAYPTKITDPAGNHSEAEYRFDAGANVWAKSPTPQGTNNSKGKETTRIYDSFGRLERETLVNHGGAYTRYEYPSNGIQAKIFATLTTGAGEIMSERWTDGAGRIRYSRVEHPGSTGGWSGSKVEYDILGRVSRSTVPTEINPVTPTNPSTWIPTGDDDRGLDTYNNPVWLWNSQEYDWQGRVTRKINTDGTDKLISYNGCGCSGGLETTIQSELVPRDDQPTVNARRKQKVYSDILGREYKSENFNWDGTSVYSTIVQNFNGRDQVTQITQYAGTENPNNTHQDTTLTYDGHGRLKTRHNPIEDAATDTTWIYNADDTIQQVIDPRGAITNYSYNDARGLLTQISYDPPVSQPTYTTIPDTPTVNFSYDAAGNRTQMTDGTGSTSYSYDELSRLKSETKTFTGLTGNFTISYDYELSGKLKSITDPFGAVVNYNDDKAGRTTSITGSGFLDVTTYASNIKYRAFGSVKEMTYGNTGNSQISYQFDNRLQVSSYDSTSSVVSGGYVRRATYEYFDDGRVKKADNLVDSGFKQMYTYDQLGRLKTNDFGTKMNVAEEEVQTYAQSLQYNVFGDITSRGTTVWGEEDGFTTSYVNGRKQNSNEIYDALGNIVDQTTSSTVYDRWKFDAAGQMTESKRRWYEGAPQQTSFDKTETITQDYDGDGKAVKWHKHRSSTQIYPQSTTVTESTKYYVRSSVLDKVLTELGDDGEKKITNVYTGNAILAEQKNFPATSGPPPTSAWSEVYWHHVDVVTGSYSETNRAGQRGSDTEIEPLGADVPTYDPYPNIEEQPIDTRPRGDVFRPEGGCAWGGMTINCDHISFITGSNDAWQIQVNVRAEGGANAYYALRNQISIWRINLYQPIDIENRNLTREFFLPKGGFDDLEKLHVGNRIIYGLLLESVYLTFVNPFLDTVVSQNLQTRRPAPLTKEENDKLDRRLIKIKEQIAKDKCREFLEKQLGKDAVSKLNAQLDDQSKRFSGPNSTNYTVEEAGFYGENARQEAIENLKGLGLQSRLTELNSSVSDWLNAPGQKKVQAIVGSQGRVFYVNFNSVTTIIHENLHVSTGLSDIPLAEKLGLGKFKDYKKASQAISKILRKKGCT